MANQGLINRITTAFRPTTKQTSKSSTVMGRVDESSKHDQISAKFKVEQDRKSIIRDANDMYHNDDRCKAIIDNTAGNATYGGFDIVITDSEVGDHEKLQEDMQHLKEILKKIRAWVKKGLIEGDLFMQPIVEGNMITKAMRMPAITMRRNSNDIDEFEEPTKAFAQIDPLSAENYAAEVTNPDAWFAQWQIVHARWNHLEGRYGNSIFRSSRGSYKKVREGETDMAIRRKTRAGLKYLHTLEDATDTDIEAYKERNKETLKNPFAAIADFFSNKKTTISAIQGDGNLGEIEDVKHHINTMFVSSPVPKSLLGYGEDINRDVLDKQEAQYLRVLEDVEDWIDDEIIRPFVDLQLLLWGILPESVTYTINWPDRSVDMFNDVIDGTVKLSSLGLPKRVWLQVLKKTITDIDVDAIVEEMEENESSSTAEDDTSIANNIADLKSRLDKADKKAVKVK